MLEKLIELIFPTSCAICGKLYKKTICPICYRSLKPEIKTKKIKEENFNLYFISFYEGKIKEIECVLVECGVGKVNAARTTQIVIDNMKVDYVFNIGVAGGIKNNMSVGDIVLAESLVQHDFDITAFHHEKGYIHKHNQNKDEDNSNNNDNNGNDNNNHDKDNNNSNDEYKTCLSLAHKTVHT